MNFVFFFYSEGESTKTNEGVNTGNEIDFEFCVNSDI